MSSTPPWILTSFFIVSREDYLTIATTRPETLFGDTAIAVNPEVCGIIFPLPLTLNLLYVWIIVLIFCTIGIFVLKCLFRFYLFSHRTSHMPETYLYKSNVILVPYPLLLGHILMRIDVNFFPCSKLFFISHIFLGLNFMVNACMHLMNQLAVFIFLAYLFGNKVKDNLQHRKNV